MELFAAQYRTVEPRVKSLEKDPHDPAANLAVGTYRALWKGDWEHGLPMLAKGGENPLAEIARRDLAEPMDAAAQVRLGDSWWDEGTKLTGRPRLFARERAVLWYDRCVDELPGLAKIRTKKRLDEYSAAEDSTKDDRPLKPSGSGAGGRPGLVAKFFRGSDFRQRLTWRIDPNINFNWGDGSPDPEVPRDFFGARWTGYLRPPTAGTYTLKLKSDNGLRWTIGDRVVYDKLSVNGQHEFEATVDLKAKPQLMRVDFLEGVFTSWCHLSWRRPGRSEFEPIPAEYFSHTRDQEPPPARH